MNIVDKYQAKRLGISEEKYEENSKIAETIWKILFCEGIIIDPFMHIRMNRRLVAIDGLFIIALVSCTFLFYNRTYSFRLLELVLLLIAIVSMFLFLIGKFLIYRQ